MYTFDNIADEWSNLQTEFLHRESEVLDAAGVSNCGKPPRYRTIDLGTPRRCSSSPGATCVAMRADLRTPPDSLTSIRPVDKLDILKKDVFRFS
jgi:hypothetical protein